MGRRREAPVPRLKCEGGGPAALQGAPPRRTDQVQAVSEAAGEASLIVKAVLGFTGFSLRGLDKVTGEWDLVALAYNCKRLHKLSLTA